MKTKCKCPSPKEEGLPEWIMSYADMITILMAFFVVMYSMVAMRPEESEPGQGGERQKAVMEALKDQFGAESSTARRPPWSIMVRPIKEHTVKPDSPDLISKSGTQATGPVGEQRKMQMIRPGETPTDGGIVLFPEGESQLTSVQKKQLELTVDQVHGKPQRIEIRGHTSRRPVPKGADFRDNWDLAYARCHNTLDHLIDLGVDSKRIALTVMAENEPPSQSQDVVARSRAGRVEVYLLNEVVDKPRNLTPSPVTEKP
jgi:chemotaxis protein MotB